MTLILDVLNVTGCAVWFVFGDYYAASPQLQTAVVTGAASGPWRLSIDRVESFVAA